jgi:Sigma-70, region 4
VILLVGLEGMSYEDAAGILSVPVGTFRSRLSRGRDILRKLLEMEDAVPWRLWRRLPDVRLGDAGLVTYFTTRRLEPSGYLHERKCQW